MKAIFQQKKILFLFVGASLLTALFSLELGAVPGQINFQGRLTGTNNIPKSGPYTFLFSIWDAEASGAGAKLWPAAGEENQNLTVTNGIFSAVLGSVLSIPDSIFSADNLYLQITVGGETLSPRQKLLSSPYSFNSSRLGGKVNTDFVGTTGDQTILGVKSFSDKIGIGILNPAYKLDVTGDINFTGNLLKNGLPTIFSNWTVTGPDLYRLGGNVGIGTSAPEEKLEVKGSQIFRIENEMAGNDAKLRWLVGSGPASDTNIVGTIRGIVVNPDNSTPLKGALELRTNSGDAVVPALYINEKQQLGIGRTDPAYPLDVLGDINLTGQLRVAGSPAVFSNWSVNGTDIYRLNGNVGIGILAPTAALDIKNSNSAQQALKIKGSASQTANLQEWQDSAGTVLSAVSPTGNVGIGTAPDAIRKLEVGGKIGLKADGINAGELKVGLGSDGAYYAVYAP